MKTTPSKSPLIIFYNFILIFNFYNRRIYVHSELFMRQEIEKLCGKLSEEEFKQVTFARWSKKSGEKLTDINFTFNTSYIAENLKQSVPFDNSGKGAVNALSMEAQKFVYQILSKWEQACGQRIKFNFVKNPEALQSKIVFAACDNLDKANGVTVYNYNPYYIEQWVTFSEVLVCIPSNIKTYFDLKTISHEIGHALGILHLHDVSSVQQKLQDTPQGMGCSVMPYAHSIKSGINDCTSEEYCLNQPHAVYPGPLDKDICYRLYDDKSVVRVISSRQKYYGAMYYGFLNGVAETALSSFLRHISYNNSPLLSQPVAHSLSVGLTSIARITLQEDNSSLIGTLAIAELMARVANSRYADGLGYMRVLLNIVTMMTLFSQLYGSDDIFWQTVYMAVFLGANFSGLVMGEGIGEQAASCTNKAIEYTGRFFRGNSEAAARPVEEDLDQRLLME